MSDDATLAPEAHDNRSVFLKNKNSGGAYRNQAIKLISICQLLSQLAPPKFVHEDAELRRIRRVCDLALHSAADSGARMTDEANARFKEATLILSNYSENLDLPLTIHSKMEIAKWHDNLERDWLHAKSGECAPTVTINFVLLRSPLLSPHDPETIIVSQELNAGPSLPEILWNFSRYKGRGRITLEQNPHFYLHCPADESIYTPKFRRRPLQDSSGALEHNDTVYVLFNRPCSIFLDIHHQLRIFDNVWSLNGFLIFRDSSGVLEGEQLVRASSIRYNLRYCEQPVVHQDSESRSRLNHRYLRPIVTPTANPTLSGDFEDWTVLSRLASHPINMHVYRSRGSNGSTSSLDVVPPPPTSERPGYHVLYTTINRLNDPILLWIFSYFLLDQNTWNFQLGWRKLSHVCQSWRHLIYETAFNFDMHILCTNGTPIVDTIDHLPHFPLFVDYREDDNRSWKPVTIGGEDELGIYHALRLRERVRRIDLHLSPLILHKFLMLMDRPFPILERLSLSFTVDKNTTLTLPKTFLASNLRHLALLGIGLPKRLRLLSSTISLVTLVLTDIQASGYFRPRLLVARLQFLPLLEELSIGFSIPLPHSSAERELLSKQGTPVTLPNLKNLRFQGVSAYLECLLAQIRAPLLERVVITLFNQIFFTLPQLSHVADVTEGLKPSTATVFFWNDEVSIILGNHRTGWYGERVTLQVVMCKHLNWQIICAAQICSALIAALSGVEVLTLGFYGRVMPRRWQNGEIDGMTWRELLRSFVGVRELRIYCSLSRELSRALQADNIGSGSNPVSLRGLPELACVSIRVFDYFIYPLRVAVRPTRWHHLGNTSSSSDRLSLYDPVRIPLSSTTMDSSVRVPPPSIFLQPPEPSSPETTEEDTSSIASSNDTLTTPPPSRRKPNASYDAVPTPIEYLEYPAIPLMRTHYSPRRLAPTAPIVIITHPPVVAVSPEVSPPISTAS